MATKRISELTAITAVTTDDNLIINDGNTATRRITFGNFMSSVAGENTTFSGNVTFDGTTSGISLDELTDVDLTTAAPTEGQVLQYDATGAKFVPATLGSGVFSTLSAFAGALDNDVNFSTTINTRLESLTGVAAAGTHLGTFTGSTITDGRNIKEALQDLETSLEAIDIDTDDLAALTGISENTTNLGTFTGTTISDNVAVKVALQEVETALELKPSAADLALKAPLVTPTFTDHVFSPEYRAAGTGHLKLRAETGNDLIIYLADSETLQITRDPSTGNPKFTAKGGTGECEFLQSVNLDAGFKIGGVAVSATAAELNLLDGVTATTAELNYVDGVTSDIQTQLDAKALASSISNVDNTSDADKPVSTATQTALDAKAGLAGGNTFTGAQVVRDKIDIKPADSTYFLRLNRNTATQLDIATGNIPSGGNLNIKNSNGTDARVVVYSDLFWVRNLGGSNGNGTAKFDGDVTFTPSASVTPADNGQLVVEATDNTTLTFKLKGSDGTVRTGTITLS